MLKNLLHSFDVRVECLSAFGSVTSQTMLSLTLCMLGNCLCFCRLLTFFKINFFKKNISGTMSNGLYPDLSVLICVKTLVKVIGRRQKLQLAGKEFKGPFIRINLLSCQPRVTVASCFVYKSYQGIIDVSKMHNNRIILFFIETGK